MFRQTINPPEIKLTQDSASLWSTGIVYKTQQSELFFGSNRRIPTKYRPTHGIKKHGSRLIVLPATSQYNSYLFHVEACDIQWNKPSNKDSYLTFRYESIPLPSAKDKTAIIKHSTCINLMDWLKQHI